MAVNPSPVFAQPVDGVVYGKPLSGSILADQPFSLVRLFFVAANLPADLPASSATGMLSNGQYIVGDLAIKDDLTLWVCTTAGTNATSVWAKISGGGGLNLRGEWDATQSGGAYVTTYSVNDLVVISLGINSGTFVWIGTAPGNSPPWTGAQNWLQLPGGILGQWM